MKMFTNTCKFCNLPQNECREQDIKLLQPPSYELIKNKTILLRDDTDSICFNLAGTSRLYKAFIYVTGLYQPNFYLCYAVNMYNRYGRDVLLSLPLCVWEEAYLHSRHYSVICVIEENVNSLPIEKEYLEILFHLDASKSPLRHTFI